jgi:hypothetical protein
VVPVGVTLAADQGGRFSGGGWPPRFALQWRRPRWLHRGDASGHAGETLAIYVGGYGYNGGGQGDGARSTAMEVGRRTSARGARRPPVKGTRRASGRREVGTDGPAVMDLHRGAYPPVPRQDGGGAADAFAFASSSHRPPRVACHGGTRPTVKVAPPEGVSGDRLPVAGGRLPSPLGLLDAVCVVRPHRGTTAGEGWAVVPPVRGWSPLEQTPPAVVSGVMGCTRSMRRARGDG